MDNDGSKPKRKYKLSAQMLAGAFAGLAVDLSLFPVDTIKTRLQSERGFWKSGGFRKIYAGIPSVALGSAPGSALFFTSYEAVKKMLTPVVPHPTMACMVAACCGETAACLIRVPTEVTKQRVQAFPKRNVGYVFRHIGATEGLAGYYRGYWSTVMREIPFSFIEFPLWETLKVAWGRRIRREVNSLESAACGSVAGIVAAGITTPLDVAKTRIMLAEKLHSHADGRIWPVLSDVYSVNGIKGLFAGFLPRIIWMGTGGFIFFGAYELAKNTYFRLATPDGGETFSFLAMENFKDKVHDYLFITGHWGDPPRKTLEETFEVTKKEIQARQDFVRRKELAQQKFRERYNITHRDNSKVDSETV